MAGVSTGEKRCDQPDQRSTGFGGNPLADGCKVLFLSTMTAQHNITTKSRTKMPKKNAFLSVDLFLGLNYPDRPVW